MTCIGRFNRKVQTEGSAPFSDMDEWCDHCNALWRVGTSFDAGFGGMALGEFKQRFPCLREVEA